jgi:acyl carrier protein
MTHAEIVAVLLAYLRETNPLVKDQGELQLDRSLHDMGVLDSSGIVELVSFIESRWPIAILDAELTSEMFGSINKMANLVDRKLADASSPAPS